MLPFSCYHTYIFSKQWLPNKYTDSVTLTQLTTNLTHLPIVALAMLNVLRDIAHHFSLRPETILFILFTMALAESAFVSKSSYIFTSPIKWTYCRSPHRLQMLMSSHLQGRDSLLNLPLCWQHTLITLQLLHISYCNITYSYLYIFSMLDDELLIGRNLIN